MVATVFTLAFLLVAVLAAIIGRSLHNEEDRRGAGILGICSAILAAIIFIASAATTVSANTVGVVTSFGRYMGTIQPGFHMLWPWQDVEEFGTRIQPLEMHDVPIRFEGNSGGDANMLVEWRIKSSSDEDVKRLWMDYRTFDAIQNRLVHSHAANALNVVLAGYTPAEGVSGAKLQEITDKVLADLNDKLANTGVVVDRVTIRGINPDAVSQDRINRQVQAKADLDRLSTTEQIAQKEADIARTRATTQTPGTLQQSCLDLTENWDASKHGPLPPTWNCGMGGNAVQTMPVR
jgi:regulator of protease activity HflC (stomatin/prohibitin superfamily)